MNIPTYFPPTEAQQDPFKERKKGGGEGRGEKKPKTWTEMHWRPTAIHSYQIHCFEEYCQPHWFWIQIHFLQHTTHITDYFSPKVKSLWGTHRVSPSFHVTHRVHSGPWAKTILWMGLPFPKGGAIHTTFPSHFPMCTMGTLSPPQYVGVLSGQDQDA